jgi:hypothetical protein
MTEPFADPIRRDDPRSSNEPVAERALVCFITLDREPTVLQATDEFTECVGQVAGHARHVGHNFRFPCDVLGVAGPGRPAAGNQDPRVEFDD